MTEIQKLNEYYNIVSSDVEMDNKTRLSYVIKHNRILNSLSKRELKEVYKFRYGKIALEDVEELNFIKENYKERLRL